MAKLVDVYSPTKPLSRRQLPLVVDETLTLVMDLKSMGLVCDNQQVRGKELEEFTRKMSVLSPQDLSQVLQVTRSDLVHVLNQAVPCVGCRRSVERLYYQLFKYGHPTLDPLIVKSDGVITIREDKQNSPQVLATLFHGHSVRLNNLVDSQPRRNKKSHRCLLHSLDSQRSRPITPAWRDVWDCMRQECKRDVCIIEASSLHTTLETYLRKHRFCGECRTKVLKAYNLLVEETEPCKEKGYVSTLYAGIKRCLPEKHLHLQTKTDYITKLINRAEPELLGSRRERHAKTLEIAQEEVLTCLGICMYERLHRIFMRMREEECTCQVFAAVAVDALCRSFETAVELKQGITQLELFYAELDREEQQKQIRREQKKLKKKRKKERMSEEIKERCNGCEENNTFEEKEETEKGCYSPSKLDGTLSCSKCSSEESLPVNSSSKSNNNNIQNTTSVPTGGCNNCTNEKSVNKDKNRRHSHEWSGGCKKNKKKGGSSCECDSPLLESCDFTSTKKESGSSSDHSHDCGYSSENNNGCCETGSLISSLSSSPAGSEVACSDSCCQQETDCIPHNRLSYGDGQPLSLQKMLEDHFYSDDDSNCYITAEEVREFKSKNGQVVEKRQQLRETLLKRFALFCVNGSMPRPLKYSPK